MLQFTTPRVGGAFLGPPCFQLVEQALLFELCKSAVRKPRQEPPFLGARLDSPVTLTHAAFKFVGLGSRLIAKQLLPLQSSARFTDMSGRKFYSVHAQKPSNMHCMLA